MAPLDCPGRCEATPLAYTCTPTEIISHINSLERHRDRCRRISIKFPFRTIDALHIDRHPMRCINPLVNIDRSARMLVLSHCGEVSERLKELASKASDLSKPGPWVQIPPSPPCCNYAVAAAAMRAMEDVVNAVEIVLEFMDRINQHDVGKLLELMTSDHTFVDALGNSIQGRENMRAAWQGYFAFCPDYWISHEEIFPSGNLVAAFGAAGGTIASSGGMSPENKWRIPAAWLATVEKSSVKEWRVYADNKPVYDILARAKPPIK